MNVYELTSNMYKAKQITLHLCTHHIDDSETWEHINKANTKEERFATTDTYAYKEFSVLMFEPTKKGHITIWGFKDERKEPAQ